MNVRELMLGDFVTFKDCLKDKEPTIIRIVQLNENGDSLVSIDGDEALDEIAIDDEVVGIPLTAEILEKNGFTDCETTNIDKEWGFSLWYPGEKNYISDSDLMINLGKRSFSVRYDSNVIYGLHYVHELRQAFRLLKIEKEIIL